ncbi:MAG: hypothetical protein HQ521_10295 [Bacteroidetes bacterium]|nr:hypothetical protein [Bacteroidota bacterium]
MSIQKFYNKNRILVIILDFFSISNQIISRFQSRSGVFFRYRRYNTHGSFEIYYSLPPVKYCNYFSAKLLHWQNNPKFIDRRKYIVEINDHPLSAVGYYKTGLSPENILKYIPKIRELYSLSNCVGIIFPCTKMVELFNFYFPNSNLSYKFKIIPGLGTNAKEFVWEKINFESPLRFLCLCSDFETKGLDIVINTWLRISKFNNASILTIACSNISEEYLNIIASCNSIFLIDKAPLTLQEKAQLLKSHNISIAPTHIHGGANIFEAIEYGHSIIYFEFHSSAHINYGVEIKMPYSFYDPEYFGVKWKSLEEFIMILKKDKKNGIFKSVEDDLFNQIMMLIQNPIKAYELGKKSIEFARYQYSTETRNILLRDLYNKQLDKH